MLLKCKCEKCKEELDISFDDTIISYVKEFGKRKLHVPTEDPPQVFDYFIIKCANPSCGFKEKVKHEDLLKMMEKQWSKLAWSYYLIEEGEKFNFQEHFTKYIMLKGLGKMVTQKDIDNNKVIKDYVRYVEGKLTEDS